MKFLMGFFIFLCIVFCITRNFVNCFKILHEIEKYNLRKYWIIQNLDQISNSTNKKWRMKLLSNPEFYQPGGPLFIQIGGAERITSLFLKYGHFRDMAKMHKAWLFTVEHRFYGDSRPTDNLSNENLKYLSTEQTLADIAHFIKSLKSDNKFFASAKIILFGRAYGGSLVVWMKHLYPDLVTGGWASSPSLLAKLEFPEYLVQIGNTIRQLNSEGCYEKIKNGISQLDNYFHTIWHRRATELMKLCDDFEANDYLNWWSLFVDIVSNVVKAVQFGNLSSICDSLRNANSDAEAIANWVTNQSHFFQNGCLHASYGKNFQILNDINNFNGVRQFFYQKCNEFGWFQTTVAATAADHPFGNKIQLFPFVKLCSDVFGNQYTENFIQMNIIETNRKYGGSSPNVGGDVFVTYGEYDPSKLIGLAKGNISIIKGANHCEDIYSESLRDSVDVRNVKRKVSQFIENLLSKD